MNSYRALCLRRRAAGRCVSCGKVKEPGRGKMWRCVACVKKYDRQKNYHKVNDRRSQHQRPMEPMEFAALIPCLKCGIIFASPDRRLIRLDERCRMKNTVLLESVGDEEALYA